MGMIQLKSPDGHSFGAYQSIPATAAPFAGGVVVLQEIFGVNSHIRNVCDRLAALGFVALAPALFDRIDRNFESGYSPAEIAIARDIPTRIDWDRMLMDVQTSIDALSSHGPVGVIGFCMGGSLAYLAATRLRGVACASAYYGSKVAALADERPRVPVHIHYGEKDHTIPIADAEIVRAKRPECEVFVYPAGHGFNCDERAGFDRECATLAWSRTITILDGCIRRT